MTSCQVFYCTNEKGKCEKIFFCNYRSDKTTLVYPSTSDHHKTRESTTALATKDNLEAQVNLYRSPDINKSS